MCAFDTKNKRDYYNGKDWMDEDFLYRPKRECHGNN